MLVGQAVLDPPEGYATPYSRSQPGDSQPSVVRVLPTDCFHSFKRLMGKRWACGGCLLQDCWIRCHSFRPALVRCSHVCSASITMQTSSR